MITTPERKYKFTTIAVRPETRDALVLAAADAGTYHHAHPSPKRFLDQLHAAGLLPRVARMLAEHEGGAA